ncbi:MAG: DNA-directed RNA polymerase subunit D [Candidatus Lokiarchaeota archaeon]|nr:DNA-directed RNA polymerase subunit D [Candidatus Lokiarchaeota archaeon]
MTRLKVNILTRTDKRMSFVVDGIDVETANALRRIMLTEVPAMAIHEVLFIENSTPLYDEIIAHRLGLIPLTSDLDSYVLSEQCKCEGAGCERCQVGIQCSVAAKDANRNVYTSDLVSLDPKIRPVSDKIMITKMSKGSKLLFEAYARLGLGKDHAKYQAATKATYKYYPEITINQAALKDYEYKGDNENDPLVTMCPRNVLKWEKNELVVTDLMRCNLCGTCMRGLETPKGAVVVKAVPGKFIFFLESSGSMPPDRIMREGIKIFQEKVGRFGDLVKELIEKQGRAG